MSEQHGARSHLFTLRVWSEEIGNGRVEWRGKLQHVTTGEAVYFREWAALLPVLLLMLRHAGATIAASSPPTLDDELESN
jgi:hypothetical protein